MRYRAEIDGLRSLAILPVLAYHASIPGVTGGFTGVDIFFVISGFLITSIILAEIESGGFSIAQFYKRRILRILPALAVVLVAVAVLAWAVMLPNEFLSVGRSIIATTLFLSNVFFWRTSGYFDAAAELKPLLHTWSLAVEEQFYIFFPLLLAGVARWFRGRFGLAIGLLSLVSFALCVVMTPGDPTTAFYLLPARIWELGIGAMIAAGAIPRIAPGRGREAAALLGIALIAWGIFGLDDEVAFPGWNALYPCLGAGLVIAYGGGSRVGRLLGHAAPVYVGRISYSLYLWHWPVIVFYPLVLGEELTGFHIPVVIALSFLLADLSYRFVETPFRSGAVRRLPAPRVLWPGAACLGALLLLGGAIATTGGAWRDYPAEVLRIAGYTDYQNTAEHTYQTGEGDGCTRTGYRDGFYDPTKCLSIDPGATNVLILGDSHAGALWRAITLAWPEVHYSRTMVSGCRPLIDAEGEAPCREINNRIYREFLPRHPMDEIILVGRWRVSDFPQVGPTIAYLRRYADRVIVFGPTVEYKGDFPILLAKERMTGADGITEKALDPAKKPISDALGPIVTAAGGEYIATYDAICDSGKCIETSPEGEPMQFDYGHLTFGGAKLVIERVKNRLRLDQKAGG